MLQRVVRVLCALFFVVVGGGALLIALLGKYRVAAEIAVLVFIVMVLISPAWAEPGSQVDTKK